MVEIGIPLTMLGQHIGVLVDDRDRRGAARASYGTLEVADLRATGRLIAASPDLSDHLRQFAQPGVELTVASSTGAILTRLDAPALPGDYTRMRGFLPRMYRLFLDGNALPRGVSQAERQRAAEELTARVAHGKPATALFAGRYENSVIVAAAAPIFSADGKQVFGVIQLAQTADRWLTLRDRALTRLLNLTLFVTLFAVVAAFWFAGRMTLRISRLGAASETALGREGNLSRVLPESEAKDELGDSIAQLLIAAWPARRVHRLPADPRRQAGARDPHPVDHHSFITREPGVRKPFLEWNGGQRKGVHRTRSGGQ